MSTYLLAFIVGEFEATAPVDAGHAAARRARAGQASADRVGREQIGAFSLKCFADYYGIPYPGDKLDLIAIPDFAVGRDGEPRRDHLSRDRAAGRRKDRLARRARARGRRRLARERAHVVRRPGHDESGGTASGSTRRSPPSWRCSRSTPGSRSGSAGRASASRARRRWRSTRSSSTRPIEFTVLQSRRLPRDVRRADLREGRVGAADARAVPGRGGFSQGHRRLPEEASVRQHRDRRPVGRARGRRRGEPVRKHDGLVDLPARLPDRRARRWPPTGARSRCRQRRFFYLADGRHRNDQLWHVPVMVRAKTDQGVATHKLLLDRGARRRSICAGKRRMGAAQRRRPRLLPRALRARPARGADAATSARCSRSSASALVSDTWAATVAGTRRRLREFLKMARLFRDETDINVWRALIGAFSYLDMIVDDARASGAGRDGARDRRRRGGASRMGAEVRARDELTRQLRGTLIGALGTLGDDPRGAATRARALRALSKTIRPRRIATWCRRWSVSWRMPATPRATKSSSNTLNPRARRRKSSATCSALANFRDLELLRADHGDDARRRGAHAECALPDAFAAAQSLPAATRRGTSSSSIGRR